ncbi:MAG TPA: glycosyltransferase family 39 protein [Candidatus Binataceae bacterium]|nr:glycosyltransferase family 39 protein [Candidatus Binataceae bacterium]
MLRFIALLVPLLAYVLGFRIIRRAGTQWRRSIILAAAGWGVALAVMTEALSFWNELAAVPLLIGWLIVGGLSAAYMLIGQAGAKPVAPADDRLKRLTSNFDRIDAALIGGMAIIVLLVGTAALISPPNTGDVVFYHMPRVMMWISNRSTAFYPTFNYAQLIYAPWAEYCMMHFELLFGGDRFVNLVQFFAYLGCIVAVSLIAEFLGAGRRGQLVAAVFCATIPVAVLEASGAKNNCVVAFWIAAAVYFLLEFGRRPGWDNTVGFGAAIALAAFTKGTALIFAPALVAAGWWIGTPEARRRFIRRIPVLLAIFLAVNGPLFIRNIRLTGTPTGAGFKDLDEDLDFANLNRTPAGVAANVVRNLAIEITVSNRIDGMVARAAARTIRMLGQNPDDPRSIKLPHFLRFMTNPLTAREDMAGAPLDLALMALTLALIVLYWRETGREIRWYTAGVIAAFILFCALLRWERWAVRYVMPVLVLEAAVAATVIERRFPRGATAAAFAMLIAALPFALLNQLRPLISVRPMGQWLATPWAPGSILTRPRADLYFADNRENLRTPYLAAAAALRGRTCRDIGLDTSFEDYDYLLTAFLNINGSGTRLRYSGVYNLTAPYARAGAAPPCAVVCFACAGVRAKWDQYRAVGGRASVFGDLVIFDVDGTIANADSGDSMDANADAGELAGRIATGFKAIGAIGTWSIYDEARLAAREAPRQANLIEARLEAVYQADSDAAWTLLYTTRVRREAESGDRLLTPQELSGLRAAAEAMDALQKEKSIRLGELRDEIARARESAQAH